ncbi:uncharacterized protein G2W53_001858 [Senna tora]|uniref:Uncharacterized protein n=1 Tax=Senna tora TaxID=362788 RepID=A0A834XI11_9FABA|nr:uncharacterized protein G2W53_001858 [Senna tora]
MESTCFSHITRRCKSLRAATIYSGTKPIPENDPNTSLSRLLIKRPIRVNFQLTYHWARPHQISLSSIRKGLRGNFQSIKIFNHSCTRLVVHHIRSQSNFLKDKATPSFPKVPTHHCKQRLGKRIKRRGGTKHTESPRLHPHNTHKVKLTRTRTAAPRGVSPKALEQHVFHRFRDPPTDWTQGWIIKNSLPNTSNDFKKIRMVNPDGLKLELPQSLNISEIQIQKNWAVIRANEREMENLSPRETKPTREIADTPIKPFLHIPNPRPSIGPCKRISFETQIKHVMLHHKIL